jgi:hypothetical protein
MQDIWEDARLQILRFDEFFATSLGKTLSQLLLGRHTPYNIEPFQFSRPSLAGGAKTLWQLPWLLPIAAVGLKAPRQSGRRFEMRIDQAAIVENKRLGPILAMIAEQQKQMDKKRSNSASRRAQHA